MADGCLRVVSSYANGAPRGTAFGSSSIGLLSHRPRRHHCGADADAAADASSRKMNDNDDNVMELCNSPSASARSASRKGQRRVVPVSLSSSLLLPHKKRIKTMMSTGAGAAAPPYFPKVDVDDREGADKNGDDDEDDDDSSIVAPSGLRPTVADDGYDASANLSDKHDEDEEDSETSMSFGSANGLDDDDIDIDAKDDTEMGDDEDDVDDDDDESSFSELSYDGAEFDFGYEARRRIVAIGPAGGQLLSHRKIEVVVEIPVEVRQDMERRAKENEMEEQQRRRSEEGARIPVELQAIFLRAQRGENVDQPPSSGVAYKVFPSWPNAATMMDARMAPADSHHGHLSSSAAAKQGEANTHAPTKPRRRGSVSAASTLQDDDDDVDVHGVEEQAPLVLDRWRPVYRSFYNYGTETPPPPTPRIPIELQNVFVKAQRGHAVDPPSTKGIAFRVFDHRWGGGGGSTIAAPSTDHHHHHHHYRPGAAENEAHAAPPVAWTRHESQDHGRPSPFVPHSPLFPKH